MTKRAAPLDVVRVDRQEQLEAICEACREDGQFAFDTEFVMEDRFEPELCLIQLANTRCVGIIDPFLPLDLGPFWELVCDERVATVVHAGQEDLAMCVHRVGRVPRLVYDVQIAAGLAGHDYPLSLQKLARVTLHVGLYKSKTLTDWRRRPLNAAQIRYAAEDVSHLLAMRSKLDERLKKRNRIEWAEEEFSRFEDLSLYRKAEEEKLSRLKGSGALKGRPVVVLRELLAWRETLAQELDRPLRAVLKDHLLVEIAKHELKSPAEVRDLRGLNLSGKHIRSLCRVVERAMATPQDQWPTPAPRDAESHEEAALIPLVTGVIRSWCLHQEIAYGLVTSKKSIRDLIRHCMNGRSPKGPPVDLLSGWRRRAIGESVLQILSGERALRVDLSNGNPLIRSTGPK